MKLEDFFNQTEPTNYVQPLNKTPSLEQFFAERVPTPKAKDIGTVKTVASDTNMTAKAAADSAPKLSDEDVDRLAMQANPAMSFQMEQSVSQKTPIMPEAPTAQAPASSAVDRFAGIDAIISQMKEQKPEATWGDFAMGLIPLGVDVLFGKGKGYALPAATQYYMGKAKEIEGKRGTLESKIAELQKIKAQEMLKEPKTLEVRGPKGEPIITPVTEAVGKEAWKKFEMGDMGKQLRFEAAQQQTKEFADRALKFQAKKELMADKEFQKQRSRYTATNDAIDILNKKSWAGDQGIGFLFAKGIFGEVGSLTNEERTAFIANPAVENKVNFYLEKYLNKGGGTFTEEDRRELIRLSKYMRERAKKLSSSIAGGYIEGYKSEGIDPSNVIGPILQYKDVPSIYDIKKPSIEEWKKSKGY